MFKNKKDLDKHVSDILSKIKNEHERNLRGFNFAKHYYNFKDFETAKRYLAGFLSVKEVNSPAHKLMGQIYEQTGQLEKAVQCYKRCLEIDEQQKDVVLKICELYCQVPVDPERARYWADRAEKLFPHSEVVFRLRETLVSADGEQNMQELEDLITNELIVRPRDVSLRVKLLKLYLDTEQIKYAYEHAIDVEKRRPHYNNIEWYYCLTDVFEAYLEEQNQQYSQSLCIHLLSALDRLVYLNLAASHEADHENRTSSSEWSRTVASAIALHSFDQHLYKAWQLKDSVTESWKTFLAHMKGQLYFHLATIILKRIKLERGNQKEASRMGASLLLAAYSFKPLNLQTPSYHAASADDQNTYKMWHDQACYRLSQSGHVIMGMCREDRSKWLGKVRDQVCTAQSKDKIFQRVFNSRSQRQTMPTSYFMYEDLLGAMSQEFPDHKTLLDYDSVSHMLHPESLHHLVWLALQHYNVMDKFQPFFGFKVFSGLQYSVSKLDNPSPESLCFLDVEAFLYATIRCSALALAEHHSLSHISPDMPPYLPASISDQLCTVDQSEWWKTAYSLFSNVATHGLGTLRRRLQHGIEVIRVLGTHGMDVGMVIHLAETFADKASELKAQTDDDLTRANEIGHLQARASLYWKSAISMLEKLAKNLTIRMPKESLFPSYGRELSMDEINVRLEDGRFFLACQAMNEGNHEAAISAFENLRSPYASFYQALTYKKLAAEEFGGKPRESITSEMRSRHIILLTRARDALYITLDRIRGDKNHPLNQALPEEIEDIETRLARIDPDTAQRRDFADSDESFSQDSEELEPDSPSQMFPLRSSKTAVAVRHPFGLQSPARMGVAKLDLSPPSRQQAEHVRPSPERLDAQVRSLAIWQDTLAKSVLEQNKALLETNRQIVEELKQNKLVVEKLTAQLELLGRQIPLIGRAHPQRRPPPPPSDQRRAAHDDTADNAENEDGYYDGYYYDEEEEYDAAHGDRDKQDFHCNPAYVYPDPPLHNDYPYGQTTGLHGTSTITYAPPHAAGRGVPPPTGYPICYPPGLAIPVVPSPPQGSPMMQGHPPMPPGAPPYYPHGSPSIFTGLSFSEGQKLPEFHFNMTAPMTSSSVVDGSSKMAVFPGHLPPPPTEVPSHAMVSAGHDGVSVPLTAAAPSVAEAPIAAAGDKFVFTPLQASSIPLAPPTAFGSQPSVSCIRSEGATNCTVPHAFQIHLPPQAVIVASPSSALNSVNGLQANVSNPTDSPSLSAGVSGTSESISFTSPVRTRKDTEETRSSYHEEDSSGPDFKPVIPLPAEVEVKTGEEDECVLFEERAKLFRYVDKEWKERGVGTAKILHNEDTDRVRILMRRDQILKTCANHHILPDMLLTPMKKVDKAWIWAARDFADGDMRMEQFCIRFKTAEIGHLFKQKFELAKEIAAKSVHVASKPPPAESGVPDSAVAAGFGDRFRPKAGSWECSVCLVLNDADSASCVACATPSPTSVAIEKKQPKVTFKFGLPPGSTASGTALGKPVLNFGFPPPSGVSVNAGTASLSSFKFGFPAAASVTTSDASLATQSSFMSLAPAPPALSQLGLTSSSSFQPSAFGSTGQAVQPSVFGSTVTSVFGSTVSSVPPSVFGSTIPSMQPRGFVFGSASTSLQSKPSGHVFGASPVKMEDPEQQPETPALGPASQLLSELAGKQKEETKSSDSKIVFAGFSFKSVPVVEQAKDEEADGSAATIDVAASPVEVPKAKPFAGFSFFKKPDEPDSVFGSRLSSSVGSVEAAFAALAQQHAKADAFRKDPKFEGFSGAGQSVFGRGGDSSTHEDFEPTVDFKPVVSLPELVDTKTGEEDEEKLFGERAKLFRYVVATKEWKERGIGEIKVLRHRATGRLRILMRRDQVLKICANHYITSDMKLQPMFTSDRTWVWIAHDFAEGELRQEKLAVKFKTPEQALDFKSVVEEAQRTASSPEPDSNRAPLAQLFKPQQGTWECSTCLVRNAAERSVCVACASPKPDGGSCVGVPLSELFKPKEGSWECADCLVRNDRDSERCVSCKSSRPGTESSGLATNAFQFGFSISSMTAGSVPAASTPDPKAPATKPSFRFGTSPPDFGKHALSSSPSAVEFRFGTPQPFTFNFGGIRPKSPTKTPKSPIDDSVEGEAPEDDGGGTGTESEGDSIYFHPVVPLPDKIEVRTGEEDEHVFYCQRGKLYRMLDGEWKERGLGDFKILIHPETGKVRLLMRREQVLKICCNHYLTADMAFLQKDERSWVWHANDFSDNEVRRETLTLRLKTPEIAQAFKRAIDRAQERTKAGAGPWPAEERPEKTDSAPKSFSFDDKLKTSPTNAFTFGSVFSSLGNVATSEVEVVYEMKASSEQIARAKRLMLPPNFYLYEALRPCPGCRGCWDDDDEHGDDSSTDSDLVIVYERKPTKEQVQRALALQLPPNFYLYEDKPPCPGCRGCTDNIPDVGAAPASESENDEETEKNGPEEEPEIDEFLVVGKTSTPLVSFADLSQKTSSFLQSSETSRNFAFPGAGKQIFYHDNKQETSDNEDGYEDGGKCNASDAYDPHYEPAIPLPELVQVSTGEEEEDKLFCERCKLYRFNVPTKEWKERGLGELKILRHRATGRCRVLMRREQVHKICCNHAIAAGMELMPMTTNETAWCWYASDFAEERQVEERFAARFKTVELARDFFNTFKACEEESAKMNLQDQ